MSTVKSKKLQVGTDATSSNNFTIYQPATPDGTLRIGVGNADSPTEVGRFNSNGYVATNAPAFSATKPNGQNISAGVWTKVIFDTERFDTDSCYDNTTNYRFTPTVAGYYHVDIELLFAASSGAGAYGITIYKNGSQYISAYRYAGGVSYGASGNITGLVYCNGTTDYIEAYGLYTGTSPQFDASTTQNNFSAHLVRAV